METFAKDFVTLLQFLIPGFVAAWVFYGLTSYPKPSQFERVVQAFIFTIFIQGAAYLLKHFCLLVGSIWYISEWNSHNDVVLSILLAIMFGIIFSYLANTDKIHKKLRDWGITKETSYPSEWFGSFLNKITYIVLHLDGELRVYGWPIEWPSEPDKGHFVLVQASWLDGDKEIPLEGVDCIMIDAKEVKMVEFMQKTWEEHDG